MWLQIRQTPVNHRQQKNRASYLYRVKYVLFAVLIYVLYQFIFNLVIPVYQTTRKIKKGFREMHTRMQDQQNSHTSQPAPSKPVAKAGDYIDFEEVK
jgi:hypothetical protein